MYLETSIVGYLGARASRNLLTAACQQVTWDFWHDRRGRYELFISELVVAEARAGDAEAAGRRLELLQGIPELKVTDDVKRLAAALIDEGAFPGKAEADALHIAIAAVHRVAYLPTWNRRRIDDPVTKPAVRAVCAAHGFACPEVCTPIEMMETDDAGR